MKQIILALTGCLLTIIVGLSIALDSAKGVAANTAKKAPPSFMFVLQAKRGEMITKGGKTFLVLKKADIHHLIEFSDRPYRIVKYISGTDLAKDWQLGKNSFEKDPPNAVLSAAGKKARIVVLDLIEVTGREVVFRLAVMEEVGWALLRLKGITLVIDMNNFMCNLLRPVDRPKLSVKMKAKEGR